MQDPDRAHPPRHAAERHDQNGHQYPLDEEPDDLPEEEAPVTRRASRHIYRQEDEPDYEEDTQYEEEEPLAPLPNNGLSTAFTAGILAGAFIAIFNIVLTYLNASTYNAAAQAAGKASSGLAGVIVGLWCLNIVISLLVCFGIGFLMGKTKIARRLGFYAGATAGAIMYIGSFVVNYIPNYPGHISSTTSGGNPAPGLITSLAVLIIQGFIGGLFGLWGAWAATRHSPYYQEA
ncbi:MAG TPA: TIGR04086 family membrane protein [Ktedonobacteraceae bacterium]|nr:TIGR04086 family membrane protein [Ktedonobacteraceae bacterium]